MTAAPGAGRRGAWVLAAVATATMTISYVDRSTLAVLAPTVTRALDLDDAQYGWLTSAFSLAYLLGTPLGGWWIDRVGARRGLPWALLAWSLVAALHAVVPGFGALVALRIALGLTEGPSFPGAAQATQRALPPAARSRGFGLLFTGSSLGAMIAPPLATWLYDLAGWRVAFLGTAALGLAWIPLWWAVTSSPEVAARLDAPAAPDGPGGADAGGGAGAPGGPGPRIPFRRLLAEPLVLRALLPILAVAPAIGFFHAWAAKYLVARFGLAQGELGGLLWLPPLLFDLGALGFADLAGRRRRAAGASPRGLVALAGLLACSLALLGEVRAPQPAMYVLGASLAGGAGVYALVTADLLGRLPPEVVSSAGGLLAGGQSLALIVASPLVGDAVKGGASYGAVAAALGLWALPGTLAWLAWRPGPPRLGAVNG